MSCKYWLTTKIYTIENTTDTAIKILRDETNIFSTSREHKLEEFVNQNGGEMTTTTNAFDDFVDD